MRYIRAISIWFITLSLFAPVKAQETSDAPDKKLSDMGFENIRSFQLDDQVFIAFENNLYRWEADAITV